MASKYTEEFVNAAKAYVNNYADHGHAFPSVTGLTRLLGISRSTIYYWAEDDTKEMQEILDQINAEQELVAWNKGLKGEYNANLVKLLLGKHGYSDKVDSTHSGPSGGPIEWTVLPVAANPDS